MENIKFIRQEKSDKELNEISSEIIDLIESKGLNFTEKYKIISTLHSSLTDIITKSGGIIQEGKNEE